jgi:hypothetical protein
MLHPHEKLARIRRDYPDDWWITLPVSRDLSLALANDAAFWRNHGQEFGWHGQETPLENALHDVPYPRNPDYERLFEPHRMTKMKLGAWCGYVAANMLGKTE